MVLKLMLTNYQAVATNTTIIDTCESYGVRSYIFIPCIVYGEGEGFGNRISIQTAAVVRAAKAVGAVYDVNPEGAVRNLSFTILSFFTNSAK
jgi:Na+-transporting NADH:ubiquinone oxidoreductase subunit NqrE